MTRRNRSSLRDSRKTQHVTQAHREATGAAEVDRFFGRTGPVYVDFLRTGFRRDSSWQARFILCLMIFSLGVSVVEFADAVQQDEARGKLSDGASLKKDKATDSSRGDGFLAKFESNIAPEVSKTDRDFLLQTAKEMPRHDQELVTLCFDLAERRRNAMGQKFEGRKGFLSVNNAQREVGIFRQVDFQASDQGFLSTVTTSTVNSISVNLDVVKGVAGGDDYKRQSLSRLIVHEVVHCVERIGSRPELHIDLSSLDEKDRGTTRVIHAADYLRSDGQTNLSKFNRKYSEFHDRMHGIIGKINGDLAANDKYDFGEKTNTHMLKVALAFIKTIDRSRYLVPPELYDSISAVSLDYTKWKDAFEQGLPGVAENLIKIGARLFETGLREFVLKPIASQTTNHDKYTETLAHLNMIDPGLLEVIDPKMAKTLNGELQKIKEAAERKLETKPGEEHVEVVIASKEGDALKFTPDTSFESLTVKEYKKLTGQTPAQGREDL